MPIGKNGRETISRHTKVLRACKIEFRLNASLIYIKTIQTLRRIILIESTELIRIQKN